MSAGRKVITDNKDWGTPSKYVEAVKAFFDGQIDLDPCSNDWSIVNAKVEYRLPNHDGLKESWSYKKIFVNPPYGKDQQRGTGIKSWIHRCELAHKTYGSEVLRAGAGGGEYSALETIHFWQSSVGLLPSPTPG